MKTLLLVNIFLFLSCTPIRSEDFNVEKAPKLNEKALLENKLQYSQQLSLKGFYGAEDILVTDSGVLYAGVHDGSFKNGKLIRINLDKSIDIIYESSHWIAGLEWVKGSSQNLYALVLGIGVVEINITNGNHVELITQIKNKKILIPNDIALDSAGNIYFTVTSFVDEFSMDNAMKMVLEQKSKGGIFKYDVVKKKVSQIHSGGVFLNGIEVSNDDSYLLFVETGKYRVYKLWLTGNKTKQKEVFIDNLEGIPNGISKSSDGHYWLGFSSSRNSDLDTLHKFPFLKTVVFNLPNFLKPKLQSFGMVMKLSAHGEVITRLYDKTGETVGEATSVVESNNHLYFGGDRSGYIPYLEL